MTADADLDVGRMGFGYGLCDHFRDGLVSLVEEMGKQIGIAVDAMGPGGSGPIAVRAPADGSVLSVINESEGVIAEGTQLPSRLAIQGKSRPWSISCRAGGVGASRCPGRNPPSGGREPLVGYVKRIEPIGKLKVSALGIEEQRVNIIVGFGRAAGEALRLGHGYQIDATIVLWSTKTALRVPIGALFRGSDDAWRVFVAEGGRARERSLQIGHLNDEYGEVLGGLADGEVVVLNPGNSLKDGSRIAPR